MCSARAWQTEPMGIIYNTSMNPSKNELLAKWLVTQDFYDGQGAPDLQDVGGFRLEDPAGEVGMELRLVADRADRSEVIYHVPFSYRAEALEGAEAYLVGTSDHGILGLRYIYDATGDPVFTAQLNELLAGRAIPQHQNNSFEEDSNVRVLGNGVSGTLEVIRRPVAGEVTGQGVVGSWENALGQPLSGLVLRIA